MKTIFLLDIGNKNELVRLFGETKERVRVVGIDIRGHEAPASVHCDAVYTTYANALTHEVPSLILPLGSELRFAQRHSLALTIQSDEQTLSVCRSKFKLARHLKKHNLPYVETTALADYTGGWDQPVFVKPEFGANGRGARMIRTRRDMLDLPFDYVVQPFVSLPEYSVDMYVTSWGRIAYADIRTRELDSDGKLVRSVTRACSDLVRVAKQAARCMKGLYGPVNVQLFDDGRIFDIHPRFFGGYALTHAAGGRFIDWAIAEIDGAEAPAYFEGAPGMELTRKPELKIRRIDL